MVGAGAMVSMDVVPFGLVQGDRARLVGLNRTGLVRAGRNKEELERLTQMFRLLFRAGLPLTLARERLEQDFPPGADRDLLLKFLGEVTRGLCRPRHRESA